ncbi:uncharacterized protein [Aristolochia californica]|uniref:uncharacterized protein isoform X2 n=1 Tax=Aristolochia californica TaxID=171875 RepID=UPI0035E33396
MPDEEEDDDTFGDFKFVASSSAAVVAFPSFAFDSEQQSVPAEDDDWGDFVDSTIQFHQASDDTYGSQKPPLNSPNIHFSDSFASLQEALPDLLSIPKKSETKQWERPKGALPLSIFGDEEKLEDQESEKVDFMFKKADIFSTKTTVENGSNSTKVISNTSVTDLISNLYGSTEQIRTENATRSDLANDEGDFEENSWEFKDALSEISGGNGDFAEEQKVSEVLGLNGGAFPGHGNQGEDFKGEKRAVGSFVAENGVDCWDVFVGNESCKQEQNVVGISGDHIEVSTNSEIQANHIRGQNGTKGGYFDENGDFGDEIWEFKDSFSEIGVQGANSVTEQKSLEVSSFDEVESSDTKIQKIEKKGEDMQKIAVSSTFNGKLEFANLCDVQDGFVSKPSIDGRNGMNGLNLKVIAGLDDLISNLYPPDEQISVANSEKETADSRFELLQSGLDNNFVNGDADWEFKDASSETKVEDNIFGSWTNISQHTANFKLQKFVEFYSNLKEESHALALYHLEGLKKAKVAAALSGEEEKVIILNDEIQSVYAKVRKETEASKKVHPEEPPKSGHGGELFETLQDPDFGVFDLKYCLSSQLSLAQGDLSVAVQLLKHASWVNHILSMASMEEQTAYVSAWSRIIVVCARELQHGSMIWRQSLQKKAHRELLLKPQAQQYFVALGKIYRVAEIIKASARLYEPWILLSCGLATNIPSILVDCTTTWSESGLKEALEGMSDSTPLEYGGSIKSLLESIKSICDLDTDALWNSSRQGHPVCRISLLSSSLTQDIKMVLWNGEHFFVTLANLWANKISCDPPQLPHILVH